MSISRSAAPFEYAQAVFVRVPKSNPEFDSRPNPKAFPWMNYQSSQNLSSEMSKTRLKAFASRTVSRIAVAVFPTMSLLEIPEGLLLTRSAGFEHFDSTP